MKPLPIINTTPANIEYIANIWFAKKLPDGGFRARYRVRPRPITFSPLARLARNGTKVSSDARNAPHEQTAHSYGRCSPC